VCQNQLPEPNQMTSMVMDCRYAIRTAGILSLHLGRVFQARLTPEDRSRSSLVTQSCFDPEIKAKPRRLVRRAYFQKERDRCPRGPVPSKLYSNYPLVTTGGGALPFPTYCAQPAMLRRASTAAIPKASFFIGVVPLAMTCRGNQSDHSAASAEKTHSTFQ
jgi:hypothetical protein